MDTIQVNHKNNILMGMVQRILRISSTDGAAKVLVFSSWNDVHDVLDCSLPANNIYILLLERKEQGIQERDIGEDSFQNAARSTIANAYSQLCEQTESTGSTT